jgi:large subunit ribosomal protein L28e
MSSDLAWAITRNNSAFLLKLRGAPKPFSTDPLNVTNKNSQRYNGYLTGKGVGITALDKGFALTVKKPTRSNRPGQSLIRTEMKSGSRTSLHKVKSLLMKQRYRKDLTKATLRKASAIIRSQKPLPARKGAKIAKTASTKKAE